MVRIPFLFDWSKNFFLHCKHCLQGISVANLKLYFEKILSYNPLSKSWEFWCMVLDDAISATKSPKRKGEG